MNKVDKYYSLIWFLAQEFYKKYFFEEKFRNWEANHEEFLENFLEDVYRIWEDNIYFWDNSVFDFYCWSYYYSANDMYVALKNNIPEKIVKNWYDESVEVLMENKNAYFPNLYHYFLERCKK